MRQKSLCIMHLGRCLLQKPPTNFSEEAVFLCRYACRASPHGCEVCEIDRTEGDLRAYVASWRQKSLFRGASLIHSSLGSPVESFPFPNLLSLYRHLWRTARIAGFIRTRARSDQVQSVGCIDPVEAEVCTSAYGLSCPGIRFIREVHAERSEIGMVQY